MGQCATFLADGFPLDWDDDVTGCDTNFCTLAEHDHERFLAAHDKGDRNLLSVDQILEIEDSNGILDPSGESTSLQKHDGFLQITKAANLGKFYMEKYTGTGSVSMQSTSYIRSLSNEVVPEQDIVKISRIDEEYDGVPSLIAIESSLEDDVEHSDDVASADFVRILRLEDGLPFLNLCLQGSFGMIDNTYCEDYDIPNTVGRSGFFKHCLQLTDGPAGKLVALCMQHETDLITPRVTVYSPHPAFPDQKYDSNVCNRGSPKLYQWAEISAEGEFPLPVRYAIHFVSPNIDEDNEKYRLEKEPRFRGSHIDVGNPNIKVVAKCSTKAPCVYKGCSLIQIQNDDITGVYFSILISENIDAALLICFTAFVDEFLESTMRRQVAQSERESRKQKQRYSMRNNFKCVNGSTIRRAPCYL